MWIINQKQIAEAVINNNLCEKKFHDRNLECQKLQIRIKSPSIHNKHDLIKISDLLQTTFLRIKKQKFIHKFCINTMKIKLYLI